MVVKNITVIDESEDRKDSKTLESNMKLLRNLRFWHIVDINMSRLFIALWLAVAVIALIPALRPSYSEVEKRELKKFPEFSFKSLASGDYFDNISLWFSDTFPFRDRLVSLNTKVENAFGINKVQLRGNV